LILLEEPYPTPFIGRDSEYLDDLIQNALAKIKLLETLIKKVNVTDFSSPILLLLLERLR
jgi:hypothetical protein